LPLDGAEQQLHGWVVLNVACVYLAQEYIKNGKSMAQIAREKGCVRWTVGAALKTNEVARGSNDVIRYAPGQVPYGFRVHRGQLVLHQQEQVAIDQIVALRHKGFSFGQIVDHLNSNGVPTKNRVKGWDRPTIYKILKRVGSNHQK
jgi:hypothetical protein